MALLKNALKNIKFSISINLNLEKLKEDVKKIYFDN